MSTLKEKVLEEIEDLMACYSGERDVETYFGFLDSFRTNREEYDELDKLSEDKHLLEMEISEVVKQLWTEELAQSWAASLNV